MAGNDSVNSYLEAILDVGPPMQSVASAEGEKAFQSYSKEVIAGFGCGYAESAGEEHEAGGFGFWPERRSRSVFYISSLFILYFSVRRLKFYNMIDYDMYDLTLAAVDECTCVSERIIDEIGVV
ncbi:putative sucrose-phosphate synthase isoform X2 [Cucumis melo var. makuwa]|uniref:Putative sucrose-phosphate synthase isoform X2 n=1 Tax=Cucumis melo var. makuwa TaxID=1194695 RepID=A0A5D3E6K3_CUCMM|nr:putative sucrose-phosphate synthase isoform X2 [Cucumis melo var. makuwa]